MDSMPTASRLINRESSSVALVASGFAARRMCFANAIALPEVFCNRIKNPENNMVASSLGFLNISLSCRHILADDRACVTGSHIDQLTSREGKSSSKLEIYSQTRL